MSSTMKIELDNGMIFNDKTNQLSYRECTQQIDLGAILGNQKNGGALPADQLKNSMNLSSMPSFDKALD